MVFGEKMKLLRAEHHLTQEALAEKLNVSRQAVSKWESGAGYPETEKLLELSRLFSVSLDYLLLDDSYVQAQKEEEPREVVRSCSGTIAIASFDQSSVTNCISVKSSKILGPGKNEPAYVLCGIDRVTFWGEHSVILGFYEDAQTVQKEIEEIHRAIGQGMPTYRLQYAAEVEFVGLFQQPKIKR